MHNKIFAGTIIVGILLGVAIRWAYPNADPPLYRQTGAPWWNESCNHDARNLVLYGKAGVDAWRPSLIAPLHTAVTAASLRVFGLNGFGLRFSAMACGVLFIVLAWAQCRAAGCSHRAGLTAAFLVAVSWNLVGMSKVALMEPEMFLALSLCFLCCLRGEGATHSLPWYFAAGVFGGAAFLGKISAVSFLAPLGLFLLAGPVAARAGRPWRRRLARSAAASMGGAAALLIGFYFWLLPEWAAFYDLIVREHLMGRAAGTHRMAINAFNFFDSQTFLAAPGLAVLFGILAAPAGRTLWLRRNAGPLAFQKWFAFLFALVVLGGGLIIHLRWDVPPQRTAWMPLVAVVAVALACEELIFAPHEPEGRGGAGWVYQAASLALAFAASFAVCGWLFSPNGGLLALASPATASWLLYDMTAKMTYKAVLLVAALGGAAALFAKREWLWRRRRGIFQGVLVFQAVLLAAASGLWLVRQSYTLRDMSHEIGALVGERAGVVGEYTVAVSTWNKMHPLFWFPKISYGNADEEKLERLFAPRYLLARETNVGGVNNQGSPTAFFQSFRQHEVARFPLYELQETTTLRSELILYERPGKPRQSVMPGGTPIGKADTLHP